MTSKQNYQGIYIPEIIIAKGFFGKLRNWERQFYTGTIVDVVRFVKAKDCPLFDEFLKGPEDSDFDRRIKGKKTICQSPLYHHDQISLKDYIKKKIYYTKSMGRFKEKHPNDLILNFKYRCWTIFVEDEKWKRLLNPLALGLLFVLAIRGCIYLFVKKF